MKIALYQPDIPQNVASIMRTLSCLGGELIIIEPTGFTLSDRNIKRVVMDYAEDLAWCKCPSFNHFLRWLSSHSLSDEECDDIVQNDRSGRKDYFWRPNFETSHNTEEGNLVQHQGGLGGRLVLVTTKAENVYTDYEFRHDDILLFGSESKGVAEAVHSAADVRLKIPMVAGKRSLNLATSVAIVAAEAHRQIGQFGL